MEPFLIASRQARPPQPSDINTDLIIPARYLKRIERTGYGPLLFADKRYLAGKAPPRGRRTRRRRSPRPQLPPQLARGRRHHHPRRRQKLRLRLQPRTRRLGRRPGRLSRPDRPRPQRRLRRYFRGQRLQQRPAPHRTARRPWTEIARAAGSIPGAEATIDLSTAPLPSTLPTATRDLSSPSPSPRNNRRRLLNGLDMVDVTLVLEDQIRAFERSAPRSDFAPRHPEPTVCSGPSSPLPGAR